MNLLKQCAFQTVYIDTTGTSLSTGSTSYAIIDMKGWDGLCYVGILGSSDATAKSAGILPYHGDSSGTFYACTTSYAAYATTTTVSAGQLVVVDIQKPTKRWHSVYAHRATEGGRIHILAIKYKGREYPVTQTTASYVGVAAQVLAVSPTSA
jgi:hypothetical protein